MQTISFLAHLHLDRGIAGPSLVVCPLSVISSWMAEFQRWCPSLRVVRIHSSDASERARIRHEVRLTPKCALGSHLTLQALAACREALLMSG